MKGKKEFRHCVLQGCPECSLYGTDECKDPELPAKRLNALKAEHRAFNQSKRHVDEGGTGARYEGLCGYPPS